MKEPKIPDYTCPMIDEVIDGIKSADSLADDITSALSGLVREMESIRLANSQLRDCVDYWKTKAEELETELNEAEKLVGTQVDEFMNLQHEKEKLAERLSEFYWKESQ